MLRLCQPMLDLEITLKYPRYDPAPILSYILIQYLKNINFQSMLMLSIFQGRCVGSTDDVESIDRFYYFCFSCLSIIFLSCPLYIIIYTLWLRYCGEVLACSPTTAGTATATPSSVCSSVYPFQVCNLKYTWSRYTIFSVPVPGIQSSVYLFQVYNFQYTCSRYTIFSLPLPGIQFSVFKICYNLLLLFKGLHKCKVKAIGNKRFPWYKSTWILWEQIKIHFFLALSPKFAIVLM